MKITNCPYCRGKLQITEYHCPTCHLTLKGEFEQSGLANLNAEQLEFVRLFILVQGNIKEMEKRLNISYPTVKNRLAEIIRSMGTDGKDEDFTDIFHDLEEGFIRVDEAIAMIEARRKRT